MFNMTEDIAGLIRLQRTFLKDESLETVKEQYYKSCESDFKQMLPYLPKTALLSLDVGSGIGGVNVLLYRHYGSLFGVHLFDKDIVHRKVRYGFKPTSSIYNIRRATINFMDMNGMPRPSFAYFTDYPTFRKYDFIMSLISCGFHYPVSTYLQHMHDTLMDDGIIFLDIRTGTDQMDMLHLYFKNITVITSSPTYDKIALSGKKYPTMVGGDK